MRTETLRPRPGEVRTENALLISTLRRVAIFNDLSERELRALADRATRRRLPAGAIAFSEGDECRELLIVEEGSLRLFKSGSNGREQLIAIERVGSTLEEVPVFDGGRYSVTACALEPTSLLSLVAKDIQRVCVQHPEVAMKVIRMLAHRLRHLDGLIEQLSFSTVRGRLVAHLLRLTEDFGRRNGSAIEFDLKENNEQLAARLGTVRELVSRNLGRLHGDGLIEIRKRTVRVADTKRLAAEMTPDSLD